MSTVIAITRTDRPDRDHWVPLLTPTGYQLVDRAIPYPDRNKKSFATFVATLTEAGDLIMKGYAIRMAEPGARRGDYIYPESLVITRA
jgi:hypothetical protein